MPTFQSVALDPRVRDFFLVGQSLPPPPRQVSASAANKDNYENKNVDQNKSISDANDCLVVPPLPPLPPGQQPHQPQPKQQQLLVRSGIATPRAMLTRSPQELVDIFLRSGQQHQQQQQEEEGQPQANSHKKRKIVDTAQHQQQQQQQHCLEPVLLDQMEGIRNQVAHKMIARTRTGQHFLIQQQDIRGVEPLIPGATLCALDAWKGVRGGNQEDDGRGVLNKTMNHRNFSSTGCRALDQLLAFPPDWIRKDSGNTNSTTTTTATRQYGLAWGYVLQISGMPAAGNATTTGKTQLALQLAVNAIRDHKNQHQLLHGPESVSEFTSLDEERRRNHLVKVRYCFSTGGHSGRGLAKRFVELLENIDNGGDGASLDPCHHRQHRRKTRIPPRADQMAFQPISKLSQLAATLAALERDWVRALRHKTDRQNYDSELPASLGAEEPMSLDYPVRNLFRSSSAASQGDAKGRSGTSSGHANNQDADCGNPPIMLIVDGLSTIPVEGDEAQHPVIERWLKRVARQYSITVIVVSNSSSSSINNGRQSMEVADFHLHLTHDTATTTKVQLIRHPAKLITQNDCISLLHNSKYGMTVPE